MGLLGVVAALAMRKTEGIIFLILHQIFWTNAANDYILSVKQPMSSAIFVVQLLGFGRMPNATTW